MAQRVHHEIRLQHPTGGEPYAVPCTAVGPPKARCSTAVAVSRWTVTATSAPSAATARRKNHFKVLALELAAGKRRRCQRPKLVKEVGFQRRDIADGTVQYAGCPGGQAATVHGGTIAGHGTVGEHRDVRGGGVEQ